MSQRFLSVQKAMSAANKASLQQLKTEMKPEAYLLALTSSYHRCRASLPCISQIACGLVQVHVVVVAAEQGLQLACQASASLLVMAAARCSQSDGELRTTWSVASLQISASVSLL